MRAFICPPTLICLIEEASPELDQVLQAEFPEGKFIEIIDRKHWRRLNRWADYISDTEQEFTWNEVPT